MIGRGGSGGPGVDRRWCRCHQADSRCAEAHAGCGGAAVHRQSRIREERRIHRRESGERDRWSRRTRTSRFDQPNYLVRRRGHKSEARTGNLAFDLFRQGVRRLIFRPGLSANEVETFLKRFAQFCLAESLDEDLVTTLWQDALPNIELVAIDGFTEKIFMSDQAFVGRFKAVLQDVMLDVLSMPDEELEDVEPRVRETCDEADAADRADLASSARSGKH